MYSLSTSRPLWYMRLGWSVDENALTANASTRAYMVAPCTAEGGAACGAARRAARCSRWRREGLRTDACVSEGCVACAWRVRCGRVAGAWRA
eukprot:5790779-Prymnesium_polylepis.1